LIEHQKIYRTIRAPSGGEWDLTENGSPENQHKFLKNHNFFFVKLNQKYVKKLCLIDLAVEIPRRSFRSIEILQRPLKNYLRSMLFSIDTFVNRSVL